MIIDCIADLHGYYPQLEGGDLLIVAGDLTAADSLPEHLEFLRWLSIQQYKKIVFIAGNHDVSLGILERTKLIYEHAEFPIVRNALEIEYLFDSGTESLYWPKLSTKGEMMCGREKLKIWGSPWTKTFEGMNPHCKAFTCDTEEELAEKWALIPEGIDILVTHSPMKGMLDKTIDGRNVGSISLKERLWRMEDPPKLIVCGHIHESYGQTFDTWYEFSDDEFDMKIVNASHVNERYQPVNKPIRIEL